MEKQRTYKITGFVEDRVITSCSDGRVVEILFEDIPSKSKEGDTLIFIDGAYVKA